MLQGKPLVFISLPLEFKSGHVIDLYVTYRIIKEQKLERSTMISVEPEDRILGKKHCQSFPLDISCCTVYVYLWTHLQWAGMILWQEQHQIKHVSLLLIPSNNVGGLHLSYRCPEYEFWYDELQWPHQELGEHGDKQPGVREAGVQVLVLPLMSCTP